ncbi:MAG: ATP-binding protein [Pirellulaceae bacterium]
MRPARLFWKILLTYAVPNILVAVTFLVVVSTWQRASALRQVGEQLVDTARVVATLYRRDLADRTDSERQQELRDLGKATGLRITIVAADGRVLGDSAEDFRRMVNHSDRPEIQQALADGLGKSVRYSSTLGVSMYYVAIPVNANVGAPVVVRVASELSAIHREIHGAWWLLWSLACATGLLAIGLTYAMVGRLIKPMGELTAATRVLAGGDYNQPIDVHRDDEIGQLGGALEHMRTDLLTRVRDLRESRQQLATVLGSMREGVLAIDARQRIMFANEASGELLNVGVTDITNRPIREVTRSREMHETAQRVLAQEDSFELEFEAPGAVRRRLMLRATRLPGDPCPGAVIVLHDVSEVRRLENLRQELVANVSHELKTPLSSIKAYSETLRLGAINDPDHNLKFLANIEEQADRLHQLIQDLLQLARVESGQQAFEITSVDVPDLVRVCVEQRMAEAAAKSIQLEIEASDDNLLALADEEGLYTIIENLISNAIRYTPENGEVRVSWRAEADRAVISVSDTGIGIAPKHQSRIFERFYRVDKARSRELGGTGLGLSIVKHLVQAFGGQVAVTSKLGEGTRFDVTLRRSDEP